MKNLITATLGTLVFAVTAMTPGTATAGPLKKDRVAAEARWLIHVDVEALLDSTVGGFLLEHAEQFNIDLDDFDDMKRELGVDPRTDLKSITLYGTGDVPGEDAIIVAVTNDRIDQAIEKLLDNDDVPIRRRALNGKPVYLIGGKGDRHYVSIQPLGAHRRIVVISDDKESFRNALDVIAGDSPAISMGRSNIPADDPQEGSLVFLSVGDIDAFGDDGPASQIIRMSDGFTADLAEVNGVLTGRASVNAESPETANDISQVLRGLVALGRLMVTQQPELAPLLELADSLNIRTRDSRISISIRYDAGELLEKAEQLMRQHGGAGHRHDHDDDWDDDWDDNDDDWFDDDDDRRHRTRHKRSRD